MTVAPVRLEHTLPITLDPLLRTIAAHAVRGVEECDFAERSHRRVVRDGALVVTVDWGRPGELLLAATGRRGPVTVDAELGALVRRWLDLDCAASEVGVRLGTSPLLGPLVAARPGLRVLGSTDGFETAVMTVLGQQVSLAAARTFGCRLVAGLGRAAPAGVRAFPSVAEVAATAPEELRAMVGLTRAQAATVVDLAQAVMDGRFHLGGEAAAGDPTAVLSGDWGWAPHPAGSPRARGRRSGCRSRPPLRAGRRPAPPRSAQPQPGHPVRRRPRAVPSAARVAERRPGRCDVARARGGEVAAGRERTARGGGT